MRDFTIVTPQYVGNSNGIKTLHKICHTINKLGGKARLLFIKSSDPNCQEIITHNPDWANPEFNTPVMLQSELNLIADSYVIYPEIMIGNPLEAKRVVRYFGNRESYCNGKMIGIGEHDYLLAHSTSTRKDAHSILFNSEINPAFHANDSLPTLQRKLDVTYVGKGYLYGGVQVLVNTMLVAREWPVNQVQLAMLLRSVKCFYTWDSWTSTNVEAVLCGAVPFFLRYDPWTEEDLDGSEIGYIPRLDLKNTNFDPIKFDADRERLRARLNELTASWDTRVHDFMFRVEKHFSERAP